MLLFWVCLVGVFELVGYNSVWVRRGKIFGMFGGSKGDDDSFLIWYW